MSLWGREERLQAEREKTEKLLNERGLMMDMKAKEFDQRGAIQNALQREAEVMFRFRSLCNEGKDKNVDEMEEGSVRKSPGLKIDELKWNDY
ncbi:hypothetical protein OSB04_019972 [Centaurea solstitialis]|uniref:Uncharacterized protein n=1 Tax=Centaurea solstitialis TaxID=347529 RepID=A0AA38WES4_9ASTR|nr:hypothetical protein OSB04_019972 [Centaurea solstitialis]